MITILQNIDLYAPEHLGKKDVVLVNGAIEGIFEKIKNIDFPRSVVKDLNGRQAIPGFIDGHVHLIGGGGEGGFTTRIPEIRAAKLLNCGVTSVIGLLGVDSVTKTLPSLFGKVMELRERGFNAHMVTGSYSYPVPTITGTVKEDMIFVDPIIGVGELALSDHRSSALTVQELKRLALECQVSSLISSKAGKIIVHMGSSKKGFSSLFEAIEDDDVKIATFLPTHSNRNEKILEEAAKWMRMGGYVDVTAGDLQKGIGIRDSIDYLTKNGGPLERILVSSDAQGSLPLFDGNGRYLSMGISDCATLFKAFGECIDSGMKSEDALKPFTSNVADFFKLKNAGRLAPGARADLLVLNPETAQIDFVVLNGKIIAKKDVESSF